MRIVTAEEMRAIDAAACDEFGLSVRELMEAAGGAILDEVIENGIVGKVLVAVGPGNNGGDGMCAARMISEINGEVTVLLATDPSKLSGEALHQYRLTAESGVMIHSPGTRNFESTLESLDEFEVLIDALLGTGSRLPVDGEIRRIVEAINLAPGLVISADIPTGIECNTGRAIGEFIAADRTICFGLPKPYLFCNEGMTASGNWSVADIGLPLELLVDAGRAQLLDELWALNRLPRRRGTANKRSAGVVLVVGGSCTFPGAGFLASLGAYRAGAGLVSFAGVEDAVAGVRAQLPECPVYALPELSGFLSGDAVAKVKELAARCDAVVLGPGLGREPSVGEFLEGAITALGESNLVLDADALWWQPELSSRPGKNAVLTPHEAEAARLLGQTVSAVSADRFAAIRKIAEEYSCQVLLKGPNSLICGPEGEIAVNPTGCALLASGGTGDVLAGVIGAYVAISGKPLEAAITAAYIHGAASEWLSSEFEGGLGALAREVADALPDARRARFEWAVNRLIDDEDDNEEDAWDHEFDDEDIEERLN